MQDTEQVTHADKQLDRVRKALTVNPSAIVMILPDEAHRELAQAAFEKQHKNAVAAKGTMLALTKREDPTLDEIIESLSHLQQMAVNARPAEHQLDNTPIGRAIEEEQQRNGKKRAARGGEPRQVGDIVRGMIKWADDVPEPRPVIGDSLRLPSGQATSIVAVFGYQPDLHVGDLVGAFEIEDTTAWRGFVFSHMGEWRLVNAMTEYTDRAESENDPMTTALDSDTSSAGTGSEQSAEIPTSTGEGHERLHEHEPEDAHVDELHDGSTSSVIDDDDDDEPEYAITSVESQDVASAEREKAKGKKRAPRVNRGKLGGAKRSSGKKR